LQAIGDVLAETFGKERVHIPTLDQAVVAHGESIGRYDRARGAVKCRFADLDTEERILFGRLV